MPLSSDRHSQQKDNESRCPRRQNQVPGPGNQSGPMSGQKPLISRWALRDAVPLGRGHHRFLDAACVVRLAPAQQPGDTVP